MAERLRIFAGMALFVLSISTISPPGACAASADGAEEDTVLEEVIVTATLAKGAPRALLAQAKNILIEVAQHVNC